MVTYYDTLMSASSGLLWSGKKKIFQGRGKSFVLSKSENFIFGKQFTRFCAQNPVKGAKRSKKRGKILMAFKQS